MNRKTKLTLGRQEDEIFHLSTVPSTQDDVKQLEERLDMTLYKEFALENGLCPKRRRIYDDLFDEIIRITKIQCLERGQLLERVKNEYKQWINTYDELYSSSMAYAMRQYLCKMEEKTDIEKTIQTLEDDCQKLRDEIENESVRFQYLTEQFHQRHTKEDKDQHLLRTHIKMLTAANAKLHRDLQNTLNQILSSTIFLGEPIDYENKQKLTKNDV